jgi:hypothetical protein
VQGRDDRDARIRARAQDRWTDQREGVVDVDDVRPTLGEDPFDSATVCRRPHDPDGDRCAADHRESRDVVAPALVQEHLVSSGAKQRDLLLHHPVLATGLARAVPVMND